MHVLFAEIWTKRLSTQKTTHPPGVGGELVRRHTPDLSYVLVAIRQFSSNPLLSAPKFCALFLSGLSVVLRP
jgi:hypothetical protein